MSSVQISEQMDNITTIIFQNSADRMFTGVIDLTALNYKKNVGHLMLALFSALGFVCADDGKTLSHSSNPTAKLIWCKPASKGSRKAEDVARPTLLGQLQGLDLTHDGTPGAGSRAAQAAAAAARPPARRAAGAPARFTRRCRSHWAPWHRLWQHAAGHLRVLCGGAKLSRRSGGPRAARGAHVRFVRRVIAPRAFSTRAALVVPFGRSRDRVQVRVRQWLRHQLGLGEAAPWAAGKTSERGRRRPPG